MVDEEKLTQAERYIQACLSEDNVAEEDLEALEKLLAEESDAAKEIALRLLDESMIRSWFRSEADPTFIDTIKKRLQLRFNDPEFVDAAMDQIHNALDATAGHAGKTVHKDVTPKPHGMKYLLVPIIAALIYVVLAYNGAITELIYGNTANTPILVTYKGNVDTDIELSKGSRLKPGTVVQTGKESQVEIRYEDGCSIIIREQTKLTVARSKGDKLLNLSEGRIDLALTEQDPPLIVETTFCRVFLTKAEATVQLIEKEQTVTVKSGEVSVRRFGKNRNSVLVTSGDQAVIRDDGSPIRIVKTAEIKQK